MDFIQVLRTKVDEAIAVRNEAKTDIDTVLAAPTAEARDLNADESVAFEAAKARHAEAGETITAAEARLAELEAIEARQAIEASVRPLLPVGEAVVGNEARTYRPDVPTSFLADLYATTFRAGDYVGAEQRMLRHNTEVSVEHRDIAVSAMAGVVPPQYLVDQFAPVARAGRPFLNSLNALPLPPDGVSFFIPRGTTGSAAAMTAEAAGFNEQDMANVDDNPRVELVTAQQDISRTLFMRGGPVVDSVIFPDLYAASELALNRSALSGSGTSPQHRGVLSVVGISAVAYTDATPTVGEIWPKFADAVQRINSLRFLPGTAIYMHPRRWGFITAATDTTGRPLFEFSTVAPNSVMGLGQAAEYGQVVGKLMGLPVITDASIPVTYSAGVPGAGTEDVVLIARTSDIVYWEDPLMQFTFEQTLSTAPGQVRLAAGRFSLFHAGRYPTGISTVSGTGLIAPTF